ncbi:hypothetical protein GH714_030916 [Hevea brasiliensis]|uniref:Anaphase-promoting complex subunit 2 n=1 Tax=Hevea brasiliensis TaxID=3981 RepID=A0A6A6LDT9_HEVBR|nr:hypothetical protein GH714_030916 [Hevea brasiliensis]
MEELAPSICNIGILDTLSDDLINEILGDYAGFCAATTALLNGAGDISVTPEFVSHVHSLCKHGLGSLVNDYFLKSLEETFEKNGSSKFWQHFDAYSNIATLGKHETPIFYHELQQLLCRALEEISSEKQYQGKCLLVLVHALQSYKECSSEEKHNSNAQKSYLFSRYQLMVSSVLMASIPRHFPEILLVFKGRLEELSTIMEGEFNGDGDTPDKDDMDLDEKSKLSCRNGEMEIDECFLEAFHVLLSHFSLSSMLLRFVFNAIVPLQLLDCTCTHTRTHAKVHDLAGDDYRASVLESIKGWIQAVPLQFLHALLAYLGDSVSCDSPSPGIKSPLASHPSPCNTPSEGLIRWQLRLEYFAYETLQDLRIAKLFEIIVDYPDSSPAIEDLKQCLEYTGQHSKLVESFISSLRYRLLTAGASTNDILHQYVSTIKALRTIDPAGVFLEAVAGSLILEADPSKGSRTQRKVDILGMIVGIIGSKTNLLMNIIHFGDSSMQRCEIMLNDLIDSKRTNHNIKATIQSTQTGQEQQETGVSLDVLDATIISSNFWPPIQDEALNVPEPVEKLLTDYANRFHEIKTPRKLLWKKNLGTVKLELQFEDRAMPFTVSPVHAAIIMQFQDHTSWTASKLASAIGVPVDVLNRRINFWISKGILAESVGANANDHVFILVEGMVDASKNGGNSGSCEELLVGDEEGERSVASVEDQIRKEMTVYEKFIMGMLTNFGSMALDRIHNTLKMFCVADPPYDKSLQQLQSFLSGLVSEEKLELRDGMYFLKK